jgi:hypothetical protein
MVLVDLGVEICAMLDESIELSPAVPVVFTDTTGSDALAVDEAPQCTLGGFFVAISIESQVSNRFLCREKLRAWLRGLTLYDFAGLVTDGAAGEDRRQREWHVHGLLSPCLCSFVNTAPVLIL